MKLSANRIILFVKDPQKVAAFYTSKLRLKIVETSEDGKWVDLDAGGFRIGLHHGGKTKLVSVAHKIVFYARNVEAAREELLEKGVKLGSVKEFSGLRFCDGKDPEGNRFQISNRK